MTAALMAAYRPVSPLPAKVIPAMHTTEISAPIRPYSMAVTPAVSPMNRAKSFFIGKGLPISNKPSCAAAPAARSSARRRCMRVNQTGKTLDASARFCTTQLLLRPIISVDANEFTRGQIESLDKETGDAAQILDLITGISDLGSDDLLCLVRLGNGNDIKRRAAVTAMCGFSYQSRIRQVKERCQSGLVQAAASNIQGLISWLLPDPLSQ